MKKKRNKRFHPHTYIYGLTCPVTGQIRYIGKTTDPQKRFYQHRTDAVRQPVRRWVLALEEQNMSPGAVLLCRLNHDDDASEMERRFISAYASPVLLNDLEKISDFDLLRAVRAHSEKGTCSQSEQELADLLGTCTSHISRKLQRLKRLGYLRGTGNRAIAIAVTRGACVPMVRCACGTSRLQDRACHNCGSSLEAA